MLDWDIDKLDHEETKDFCSIIRNSSRYLYGISEARP